MRRLIVAALIALAPALPVHAQDSLAMSNAPAPTQIRLPLVRAIADGSRVVLQVVGSTDAPSGDTDGQFIGPSGYVPTISQAQDIRGPAGSTATSNPVPGPMGAPGKSAYQAWLDDGNTGTESNFVASLRGAQGTPGTPGSTGAPGPTGAAGPAGPIGPAGPAGPAGAKGDAGSSPTLSIGTVTTLAAGSSATATLSGTGSAPVLNLGIPAGPQGPAAATSVVFLTNVTLAQSALVSIAAGPRQVAVATNCQMNDRLVMHPVAALPAGYMLGDMVCASAGNALATLYAPLLAIGANYSIAVRVTAFR
jgi:hypothetical protein